MIGPDEARAREIFPVSNAVRLVLFLTNAGTGTAANIRLSLIGMRDAGGEERIEAIAPGQSVVRPVRLQTIRLPRTGPMLRRNASKSRTTVTAGRGVT